MLFLGIVAASLIFLSAYGGMVSLAQVVDLRDRGLRRSATRPRTATRKASTSAGTRGGACSLGARVAVGVGLLFGALASRSVGIYFLMITLTYSVIANLVFGQVTDVSGFGGISGIPRRITIGRRRRAPEPPLLRRARASPSRSTCCFATSSRTPFGLTLAGRSRRPRPDVVARLQRRPAPARSRSPSRRSSPASAACSSSGGTATSTRRRSTSARRSTCS